MPIVELAIGALAIAIVGVVVRVTAVTGALTVVGALTEAGTLRVSLTLRISLTLIVVGAPVIAIPLVVVVVALATSVWGPSW